MEEISKINSLKKKKMKIKKEDESYSIFDNSKKEISKEEYDNRVKSSVLFMRNPLSRPFLLEIRPDSKKKWRKKKRIYFRLQLKPETKNNKIKSYPKIKTKPEQNSYMNLQPRQTWLNCKKVFNGCLKGYNPDEYSKETLFQKFNREKQAIGNTNYRIGLRANIDTLSLMDKPIISFSKNDARKKTVKMNKNTLLFKSLNMNLKFRPKRESNFVRVLNKTLSSNFINKGISNILESRNIEDINALKEFRFGKDNNNNKEKKEVKINLYSRLGRKRLSLINSQITKLETAKKMGISPDFQYKINSFFYTADKYTKHLKNEEESDLEIVEEGGNFFIKESKIKRLTLDNLNQNQSDFNFFCLKNIFRLDQFHIFGLISGKGKEPKKCSRLLKKILVNFFSEEKNYINNEILEKNQFKQKIDYILYLLITDDFKFIKDKFITLEFELENMGIDIENTGATLSLIIFIKDKIISIKLGDIHPYFIYSVYDEKLKNSLLIRNPHWGHNLNNILEQDRLEENKCQIKETKNKIGKINYKIEYIYDEDIRNILNNDNIKCTRMIGYKKLRQIGILNKPDIQTFSMDVSKITDEKFGAKKSNNNSHSSDYEFHKLIKKKGINFINVFLKFVIIGNDELFGVMKNFYYIKEIYEAVIKDEIGNKNKNNFKYFFNLKKLIKKLVIDSVNINNIFMNKNSLRDLSLAIVTLEES